MSTEIIEGDCIEVMKKMDAGSIDCMVTDPPYGIAYHGRQAERLKKIANDDVFDPEWQLAWLKASFRVLKDGSHIYVFCSEGHVGDFRNTITEAGFKIMRMLIWEKKHHGLGDMIGGYLPMTELILFAHKPGEERALEREGQRNIIEAAGIRKMEFHRTEKPLGVLRPLILNSSKEGETVLDPFAGSGSLGVTAKEENRNAVLIELESEYVEVIKGRLAQEGLF